LSAFSLKFRNKISIRTKLTVTHCLINMIITFYGAAWSFVYETAC